MCSLIAFDNQKNPSYTIRCANALTAPAEGVIVTSWCDEEGGYVSSSTKFTVASSSGEQTPTPRPVVGPSGAQCSRNGPQSTCHVDGPSELAVEVGELQMFSLTSDCPAASCRTHWWATFGTCEVTVAYDDVSNPSYTISAIAGSQGRGGSILTEWCDENGGYLNYSVNFVVLGSLPDVSAGIAAQSGLFKEGQNQSYVQAAEVRSDGPGTTPNSEGDTPIGMVVGVAFFLILLIAVGCGLVYFYRQKHSVAMQHAQPAIRDEEEGLPEEGLPQPSTRELPRPASLEEREY